MVEKKSQDFDDDAIAREVEKLLRKLPGADPYLKGDPEPAASRTQPARGAVAIAAPRWRPRGPSRVQKIGVWVRVELGALLGMVITQWPYSHACGIALSLYLGAITAIVVAGSWAGVWSWRYRMGAAHAASIAVAFWGIALVANQALERVGYAAVSAAWRCGG